MRVLIDECLPRKFKDTLLGHECETVPDAGLAGQANGELLAAAEKQGFEVFLTIDAGIPYQQNLKECRIAILVIRTRSNRLPDLAPKAAECLAVLLSIKPGQVVIVGN